MADNNTRTALVVSQHDYPIDFAIGAWLHAKHMRTQSKATRYKYAMTLESFRGMSRERGFDLDGPTRELATIAQAWANLPRRRDGAPAAPATVNLRLAVVSSFYTYARRMDYLRVENPIERVQRASGDTTHAATPLTDQDVAARLAKIGTDTPSDRRDRALLAIALTTGRRLSEIAGMRVGDVKLQVANNGQPHAVIDWPRTKGGKTMRDELPAEVAAILAAYLVSDRVNTDATSPVWVSYAGPDASRGAALGTHGIEAVCLKWLDTTKFHTTRHTFARAMEDAGAKVSEIQARLGHSNIAITSRYLARNRRAVNPYASKIATMLGLTVAE